MVLRQTLSEAVSGFWDGGKKSVFDWEVENFNHPTTDKQGQFVKVGSWEANHWFCVALGKTIKLTLANAKRHLRAVTQVPSTFEYVDGG